MWNVPNFAVVGLFTLEEDSEGKRRLEEYKVDLWLPQLVNFYSTLFLGLVRFVFQNKGKQVGRKNVTNLFNQSRWA